jgi:lambda family phage tail tape measure protein
MANAPTGAAGRQPTGVAAQQRRGAVDTGDFALAQQNVQQAQALLDNLLSFQEKAQTLFGDEQTTALTAGFTSQNYELEKTIQLETQRFDLMRKGYSDERIAVEQKIAQAQIERDARLVGAEGDEARVLAVNAGYEQQIALLERLYAVQTAPGAKLAAFISQTRTALVDLEGLSVRVSQSIGEAIGSSLANGISSLIEGTATAKEVFADFLKSIGQMLVQEGTKMIAMYIAIAIAKAIAGMGGGPTANPTAPGGDWMSAVGRLSPNAKGNAFSIGGVVPYAKGGIVTSPTLFKFADGGTTRNGLMGEAGPEAIMPLQRGADGKLGVQANGLRDAMERDRYNTGSGAPVLNMSFETTNIGGVEYVSRDQLEQAMAETRRSATRDGAQRGMSMTLDRIQNSSSTRRRIGV